MYVMYVMYVMYTHIYINVCMYVLTCICMYTCVCGCENTRTLPIGDQGTLYNIMMINYYGKPKVWLCVPYFWTTPTSHDRFESFC